MVKSGPALARGSIPPQSAYCGIKAGADLPIQGERNCCARKVKSISPWRMPALNTPQFD
jgi:hypothetical protein